MCTATDLASCRWNFRSVYTSVLAFWGEKKQLRDLGGQIYKVKLIITIGEACVSLHWPLLPPSHRALIFVYCGFSCSASKFEGNWFLQMLWQGHISSFASRCSFSPISPALCHSARPDLVGTDWNNTKDGTLKKKKKILLRTWSIFMCSRRDWGLGVARKESCRAEFHGDFFFFWFIQRLLCVGYSKSSIHPHPGGKSSELHAWVVLHLTAAIQ